MIISPLIEGCPDGFTLAIACIDISDCIVAFSSSKLILLLVRPERPRLPSAKGFDSVLVGGRMVGLRGGRVVACGGEELELR